MRITILGSGNVATHLAKHMHKIGHVIVQIYSRSLNNASSLANIVDAQAVNSINLLNTNIDLLLISINDNAIEQVADKLLFEPKLIAHTAGSISINALQKFPNHGVFYPLQTFSKKRDVNMKQVPLCIEGNNSESLNVLMKLAQSISDIVIKLSTEQRLQCHLSAVFANNFTNYMFAISEQLLADKQIPFDILKPLIIETAAKIQSMSPTEAQTGPALRNDTNTINYHKSLLSSSHLKKIYSFVSDSILNMKRLREIERD